MSYDISLTVQSGTPKPDPDPLWGDWDGQSDVWSSPNYTSNCARMWREAGFDFTDYEGKPAGDMVGPLLDAIHRMIADPAKYKAMNPENGWGSYDTVLPWLTTIVEGCKWHDLALVHVSH